MNTNHPIQVLAFYQFCKIEDPQAEVKAHKLFFKDKDITSRVYISEQGINGQMSASKKAAEEYIEWMRSKPEFVNTHFKFHQWHEHAFPRQIVKYRKSLVGYDKEINLTIGGKHLDPKEWKEMLESNKNHLLIDVRNDYESKIGHFNGAELPVCNTFREFEDYADKLKQEKDPKTTPVMMYCTGGIRCELYSSILMERGFEEVYQLNGGVINYGNKEGSKHWLGKLFVFDDRLAVPISAEETPMIGKCHQCDTPIENYYNCANMDCNTLFLSCTACSEKLIGCCSLECKNGDRIRPYHTVNPHKPFRKKHLL